MSRGILATLLGIAAAVSQTVNIVNTINTLVNAIHNLLFPAGPPIDFQNQASEIASIQAHVLDPTYGLQAIQALMVANQTALLAAIAGVTQTGVPVTLPSVFPSGWTTGTGDAVWGWPVPTTTNPAYTFLQHAGDGAIQRGEVLTTDESAEADALWRVNGVWGFDNVSFPNPNSTTTLDVSTILASDATSADWLNRVYASVGWAVTFQNGCLGIGDLGSTNWNWYVDLPIDKWLQLKANLGLTSSVRVPPVWPGVANVTLGSTTALTNGLMLTGPMDGVIVAILSAPPGKAKYAYGLINAYQHIAALSFTDDDGHQEGFEPIQFESQIYVPKSMVTAAGVIFRVDPAVTGTVTPWTNN